MLSRGVHAKQVLLQELCSVVVHTGKQLPALCLLLDLHAPKLIDMEVICNNTAPHLSHVPERVEELSLFGVSPRRNTVCFDEEGLGELVFTGRLQATAERAW